MNNEITGLSLGIQDLEALEAPKDGRGARAAGIAVGLAIGLTILVVLT